MELILVVDGEDENSISFRLEITDKDMADEVFDTFIEILPETLQELKNRLDINQQIREL